MRRFVIALLVAGTAGLSACNAKAMDAGPLATKAFPVGGFTRVETAGSYDVNVRTGGKAGVIVKGPQNVIDQLVVEVKDGALRIHPKDGFKLGGGIHFGKHQRVSIEVTTESLDGASIAGSGDLTVDQVKGQAFDGSIAGSGSMAVGQVAVTTIKLNVAGSGAFRASGKAVNADYSIAGSGGFETASLDVEHLKVSIAGSGDIAAHATNSADINIMGSGDVTVTGGAKCTISKAGSGSAHCS